MFGQNQSGAAQLSPPLSSPRRPQDLFHKISTDRRTWLYASGPIEEFLTPKDAVMGVPWASSLFKGAPGDAEPQVGGHLQR